MSAAMSRPIERRAVMAWLTGAIATAVAGCGSGASSPPGSETERPEFDGPFTITQDAMVIEAMTILHPLVVQADHVIVRNCLIKAATDNPADQPLLLVSPGTRTTVIDGNQIQGPDDPSLGQAASGVKLYGDDIDFSGNQVSRIAGDAITLDGTDLRVRNNHVYDFLLRKGVHYDGIVYNEERANGTVEITGNRVEMWLAEGMTSAISLPDAAARMVVSGNWLAGGAYALMGGGGNVKIMDNRFSTKFAPTCGLFGTHAHLGDRYPRGILWSGNQWADGPSAGATINA